VRACMCVGLCGLAYMYMCVRADGRVGVCKEEDKTKEYARRKRKSLQPTYNTEKR